MLFHAVVTILTCVIKTDKDITVVNDGPVYLVEILLGNEPKEFKK